MRHVTWHAPCATRHATCHATRYARCYAQLRVRSPCRPLYARSVGFGFQFFNGFTLPFPLNLIFLPLTILEWFLRIQISMSDTALVR